MSHIRGGISRRFRLAIGILSAGVLITALAACSSGGATVGSNASASGEKCAAPPTVNISQNAVPVELVLLAADGLGYFNDLEKACNTHINLQTIPAPPAAVAALTSGQVQFASVGTSVVVNAIAQGQPLTILSNHQQGGAAFFVAPAAKQSEYGTGVGAVLKAGPGKTWVFAALGGPNQVLADVIMDKSGVDYKKVNYQAAGSAGTVAAVTSGKADASAVSAPQLTAAGNALYPMLYGSSKSVYQLTGFFPEDALATTTSFTKQYPVLTQMIVTAMIKAQLKITADKNAPSEIFNAMPASYRSTTTEAAWDKSWPSFWGTAAPATGQITTKQLQVLLNDAIKFGIIKPKNPKLPASAADTKWVDQAYKDLGKTAPTGPINESDLINLDVG